MEKEDFALIVLRPENRALRPVQRFHYLVSGRFWEFLQGSWETKPESDPEAVAISELEKETGFRVTGLERLGHLYEAYGFSNQGFHLLLADALRPDGLSKDCEEQDMLTASFGRAEIMEMISSCAIKDAPTIAALGLLATVESG